MIGSGPISGLAPIAVYLVIPALGMRCRAWGCQYRTKPRRRVQLGAEHGDNGSINPTTK